MAESSIAVFDLDGTLVDSAPDLVWVLNTVLTQEGCPPLALERIRPFVGQGGLLLLKHSLEAHGWDMAKTDLQGLYKRFLSLYAATIAQRSKTIAGVEEALDSLKNMGWILAVCTNKLTAHARTLLSRLSLEHYFSAICGRDSVPICKPNPHHLIHTITVAQGNPKYAVMIGDSSVDIDTARSAGIPVIAVSFGYSPDCLELYKPDAFVHHFNEIPHAIKNLKLMDLNKSIKGG